MIIGKNVFDQPIKNDKITYEILEKLILAKEMIMQLVVYQVVHIKKIIAIDLSKQQALDADPRTIQQINFTADLDSDGDTRKFLFLKKQKNLFWTFHKEL